jgi:hypothetical protein
MQNLVYSDPTFDVYMATGGISMKLRQNERADVITDKASVAVV